MDMEFNVFPNYKVPIEFIFYDKLGEMHVQRIGWVSTPDIAQLKKDHYEHTSLVSR